MTEQVDIEVLYIAPADNPDYSPTRPWTTGRWVVRAFGGDPHKLFAREHVQGRAYAVGVALAKVFAERINPSGKCELYVRGLDGGIRERNTYPRSADPVESKG